MFCAEEQHIYLKIDLMSVARHTYSTQNNKYAVSLQYVKKELIYEIDDLHDDIRESLLQADSIIFYGFSQACPNYPSNFAISS